MTMKINRENYEICFIDYFDGNLNETDIAALMDFLKDNPDLKKEFDSFENINLNYDENIVFQDKSMLKKKEIISLGDINESNYEDYFIGYYEETLSNNQNQNLTIFLEQNTELADEFNNWEKIKTQP